jgi:hypothetical protein
MLQHVCAHLDIIAASLQVRLLARGVSGAHTAEELATFIADRARRIEASPGAPDLSRIGLNPAEQQVVWLLLAVALRRDVRRMVAQLAEHGTVELTLEMIRSLVYGDAPSSAAYRELSAAGLLQRLGILERTDTCGGDAHESRRTWAISSRMRDWLIEPNSLAPAEASRLPIAVAAPTREAVAEALRNGAGILVVAGMPGLGRRTLLLDATRTTGTSVLEIDLQRVPCELGPMRARLRDMALQSRLTGAAPLLCNLDALVDDVSSENSDDTLSGNSGDSGAAQAALVSTDAANERGVERHDRHGQKARDTGAPPSGARAGRSGQARRGLEANRRTRRR